MGIDFNLSVQNEIHFYLAYSCAVQMIYSDGFTHESPERHCAVDSVWNLHSRGPGLDNIALIWALLYQPVAISVTIALLLKTTKWCNISKYKNEKFIWRNKRPHSLILYKWWTFSISVELIIYSDGCSVCWRVYLNDGQIKSQITARNLLERCFQFTKLFIIFTMQLNYLNHYN